MTMDHDMTENLFHRFLVTMWQPCDEASTSWHHDHEIKNHNTLYWDYVDDWKFLGGLAADQKSI